MEASPPTELILVRHAQPLGGTRDPGLTAEGQQQSEALSRWLSHDRIDAVVSSSLRRAIETAAPIARVAGVAPKQLPDLAEWDSTPPRPLYLPLEELGAEHPVMLALTEGRYSDFVPSFDHDAFRRRAESVLNELFELLPGGRIVAVSHGGLINAMLANVLGLTHQMFFVFPAYTAMSIVQRVPSGRVVLRSVNETPHLLGDRRPGTNRPTPLDG